MFEGIGNDQLLFFGECFLGDFPGFASMLFKGFVLDEGRAFEAVHS